MAKAGHHVSYLTNPTEEKFIEAANTNNIMVVNAHGAGGDGRLGFNGDIYDGTPGKTPLAGFLLGGTKTNPKDDDYYQGFRGAGASGRKLPREWVSANELEDKIKNPGLVVAAASCRAARTNRLKEAMGCWFVGLLVRTTTATLSILC